MENKELVEVLQNFVNKVDTINKRLVLAVIVSIAAFCVTSAIVATVYFTSSYDYGMVTQYQSGDGEKTQSIGGELYD